MSGDAPRIVAFLCTWCAYAGADKAGLSQLPLPAGLLPVRVPCSGRVEPEMVLKAFAEGADGVLVLGCHLGDCRYKEGNCRAVARHRALLGLLAQLGIPGDRCRLDFVSSSEGARLQEIAGEMAARLAALGPLTSTGGM